MITFIGYDKREGNAFAVARHSFLRRQAVPGPVFGLVLQDLQWRGLYKREIRLEKTALDGTLMFDVPSSNYMSTEFAISRFFVPELVKRSGKWKKPYGWALFSDCDVLYRANVGLLKNYMEPKYALLCVQHPHYVSQDKVKMDGQPQSGYARKNWSSVMLWNLDHPAHDRLTLEMLNTERGLKLHQFCWLKDDEIGALPLEYNWLVRESAPVADPKIVHFTLGIPTMRGYENDPYADEWFRVAQDWAAPCPLPLL